MRDGLWRLTAKYETVCERCRGYIKIGSQIVKEEGGTRYSHAVCPGDVQAPRVKAEPTTYIEFVPDKDGNLIAVERTLE